MWNDMPSTIGVIGRCVMCVRNIHVSPWAEEYEVLIGICTQSGAALAAVLQAPKFLREVTNAWFDIKFTRSTATQTSSSFYNVAPSHQSLPHEHPAT